MLGILCDMCGVQSDKSYRARNYHKYLSPPPSVTHWALLDWIKDLSLVQFDPRGFPVAVVKAARELQDEPSICFNGKRYADITQILYILFRVEDTNSRTS